MEDDRTAEADGPREPQSPDRFGIGRLFWLTSEAIVGADLAAEEIVLWNPAAARLFGYTAAEALGMPLERLVPDFIRPQHVAGTRRYRQGATPAVLVGTGPVQVPALAKDGTLREISLSLTDVSDGSPNRFVLAVVRDVTALVEAERTWHRTNQAMREFVATASHDLRTPLTSVLGFARLLGEQRGALDDEQRVCIDAILRGATQATRLVDDLLTLSQLQAGVMTTHPEVVPVAAVAREAAARSGVVARVEVDDALAAYADAHHVERILGNYLSNAARYGRAPIRVTGADEEGSHVVVRVCDAGAGVPEDFVDRLFTAFARVEPASGEGTGLGLSIIKGLAEANGGAVLYERLPDGAGVCFGVRLPTAAA